LPLFRANRSCRERDSLLELCAVVAGALLAHV
jgi:hypothetical protein